MKHNKKMRRVLLTLTLAIVLCLSSMSMAFGAGEPITGNETTPATAFITKILQMPEGTTTPGVTFKFDITSKTVDGVTATASNMPVINEKSIAVSSSDTGTVASGLKTVAKETTEDIFKDVNWPHAGVYTYTITEQTATYTGIDSATETMTYSPATYDITVYVANKTDGSGLYVAAIGTEIKVVDYEG